MLHLPNVMHLATDVAGVARPTTSPRSALAAALHPSAAVCGTPTEVAGARDRRARGHGPGPLRRAGRLDGRRRRRRVGHRAALRRRSTPDDPRRLRLFAGCGIVAGSEPEAELAESDAKLVPMRDALTVGD